MAMLPLLREYARKKTGSPVEAARFPNESKYYPVNLCFPQL